MVRTSPGNSPSHGDGVVLRRPLPRPPRRFGMSRNLVRLGLLAILCAVLMGGFAKDASAQVCAGGTVANGAIGDFVWFDQPERPPRRRRGDARHQRRRAGTARQLGRTRRRPQTTGAAVGSIPGTYGFIELCSGTYTVTIVSGVPAGYVPTVSPAGATQRRQQHQPRDRHLVRNPNGRSPEGRHG